MSAKKSNYSAAYLLHKILKQSVYFVTKIYENESILIWNYDFHQQSSNIPALRAYGKHFFKLILSERACSCLQTL